MISNSTRRMVPLATSTSRNGKWIVAVWPQCGCTNTSLADESSGAISNLPPLRVSLLYIFTFRQQLKELSCYEYFGQCRRGPCFRRWKFPQLFLLKSGEGLGHTRRKPRRSEHKAQSCWPACFRGSSRGGPPFQSAACGCTDFTDVSASWRAESGVSAGRCGEAFLRAVG